VYLVGKQKKKERCVNAEVGKKKERNIEDSWVQFFSGKQPGKKGPCREIRERKKENLSPC